MFKFRSSLKETGGTGTKIYFQWEENPDTPGLPTTRWLLGRRREVRSPKVSVFMDEGEGEGVW